MISRTSAAFLVVALAAFLESTDAHAQPVQKGFALDRFDPAERGSGWFVLESLDFRGQVRPAFGVVGDYSYKPLVAYEDPSGRELSAIVRHQLFAHLGGSPVLWERVRLGFDPPVPAHHAGSGGAAGKNNTSHN